MDDGTKHKTSYYLHTECFDTNSHKLLVEMLKKNFNIRASIHKIRNHNFLYINKESRDLFTELIKNFICESMKYKLHINGSV